MMTALKFNYRNVNWPVAVTEFHLKYGCDLGYDIKDALDEDYTSDTDNANSDCVWDRRERVMFEEIEELNVAWGLLYDEINDLDATDEQIQGHAQDVLKEMCDVIYTICGTAAAFNWDISDAFDKVHSSNMTKDGGAVNGKITKGENYQQPDLFDDV